MKLTITSENPSFKLRPESDSIENLHTNLDDIKCFSIESADIISYKTLRELEKSNFNYCIKKSKGGKPKTGWFPMPGKLK